ncbi:rhodanese-like domain-containing protein [Sanguibacter sp. 25GB23B1]|uniref:rhodanese-like domain-containing protein n=1 Tax=unclassified Sanguibacter TaxID=2645534 RepID=UPI0032B0057E
MNRILSAVGVTLLALTLASCGGDESEPAAVAVPDDAVILDVRTAAEYAEGHLEGAELLDFTGGDLSAALPTLDPDTEYLVYCASGNRSGQAVALMAEAGLTEVTDLGGINEAAETTELSIVR